MKLLQALAVLQIAVCHQEDSLLTLSSEEVKQRNDLLCACNGLHLIAGDDAWHSNAVSLLELSELSLLVDDPEDKPTRFTTELGSASPAANIPTAANATVAEDSTIAKRVTADPEEKSTIHTKEVGDMPEQGAQLKGGKKKCLCKKKSSIRKKDDRGNWRERARKCKGADRKDDKGQEDELTARRARLAALEKGMEEERLKQLELERLQKLAEAKRKAEEERARMEKEAKCKADVMKELKTKAEIDKHTRKCASYDAMEGFRPKGASVPQHAPISKTDWETSVAAAKDKPECGGEVHQPRSSDAMYDGAMHASTPDVAKMMRDGDNQTVAMAKVVEIPAGLGGQAKPKNLNPDFLSGHELDVQEGMHSQIETTGSMTAGPMAGAQEIFDASVVPISEIPTSVVPGSNAEDKVGKKAERVENKIPSLANGGGEEPPLEPEPMQKGPSAAVAKEMPLINLAQLEGPSTADRMDDLSQ